MENRMKNFDFLDRQLVKDFIKRGKKIKTPKKPKVKIKVGRKAYLEAERIVSNLDYNEMF